MPSTQEFRRRVKSVNNTKQITKAMEMIASIKMQKAVRTAASARSYIQNAWNMLEKMAGLILPADHPLVCKRKVEKTAVILVTSDRGLCGSYNSEVIKKFINYISSNKKIILNESEESSEHSERAALPRSFAKAQDDKSSVDVIAVGKRGAEFVKRYNAGNLVAEFPGLKNDVNIEDILPISKLTIGEFLSGSYDRVIIVYSHFESSLKQTPVVKQLLPIVDDHIDKPELWTKEENRDIITDYKFEPNPETILDDILKQVLRTQILGAVLEANASEHSARMVAMKSATDSAKDLIDELKLIYNSVRQGSITREIAEISGAAEAMK